MTTLSDNSSSIFAALVKFKAECPQIPRESTVKVTTRSGSSYEFRYADLPTIDRIITPHLTKNGLAISQFVGGPGSLTTVLVHESGEYMSTVSSMPVDGVVDKQTLGGVITYLRRYALCAILGIVSDDDLDAEPGATQPLRKAQTKKKEEPPKSPTAPPPGGQPKLLNFTAEVKKLMISKINAGETSLVKERMAAYFIPVADKAELNQMINAKELEKGTKADVKEGA